MKKVLSIIGIVILVVLLRVTLFSSLVAKGEVVFYDIMANFAVDAGPFGQKFKPADKNIVIVAIDDKSRKELSKYPGLNIGTWPWRRNVWSDVLGYIEKGKPKAVLFDLVFQDVDDTRYYDWEFANTLRRYDNVVLSTSLNNPKYLVDLVNAENKKRGLPNEEISNGDFIPTGNPLDVVIKDKKVENNITYYSHLPVADRYSKYNTIAVVNKISEGDSTLRRSAPVFKLVKNGETYYMPSLAFAGFLKSMGEGDKVHIGKGKVTYKGREIPIDSSGSSYLAWHGSGGSNRQDYKYISVSDIILRDYQKETISPDYFKDKLVLIGKIDTDIHASSVNPNTPGTEAVATALDNYINDTNIANPMSRKMLKPVSVVFEYFIIIFLCSMIILIGFKSGSAFLGLLDSFLVISLYILCAIFMYAHPGIRIWMPVAGPMYYVIVISAIVYSFRLHHESTKKAEVMNMFGKFVSPSVLSQLMEESEGLVLKNTKKPITVMFCDVKDFTTLSEKCDPAQLVENLNELFNEIVNIIFENNGTVDKFVGDCVMAYWGDPIASKDDAFMAVKTALEIKKMVNELKITNTKEGKIVFDVKIGINTGDALLGLAGSEKIMSYTAMGDAVNVASRLETSCSKLKKDILISESTYNDAKSKIVALEVDKISLKGKDERVLVYEPIGLIEDVSDENQELSEES